MRGMRWRVLHAGAALALLLAPMPEAGAAASSVQTFLDGKTYQALSEESRTQYVLGLYDMLQRMTEAVTEPKTRETLARFNRCTSGMTAAQLRGFVDSYLVSDAGSAQYAMASNFLAALNLRCP
ncbi:MAG: hypothetical protein ACM3O6_15930 [Acidobacteriota bacterium]